MHLEYISHSCFVIKTGTTTIAFDPWITGSAYSDQWYLYPLPHDPGPAEQADVILISHGHEDHLHHQSLQRIQKNAHVFFPFQWRKGVVEYLNHIGFEAITEAISFKTYSFRDVQITYLGYSLESVIVVEGDGKVLVNINDALNSNHETAVDFLLHRIKSLWPKIDYLLSGWSGAGYFPNKVHYRGKDDYEVARIREQYFADNFCRFTQFLKPSIAIPFAPGFVLLHEENRWINEIKFPRSVLTEYYLRNFDAESNIDFPIMYPGDYLENGFLTKISPFHQFNGDSEIYRNLNNVFSSEIKKVNIKVFMSDFEMELLQSKLLFWLNKNSSLYKPEVVADAIFSIRFTDIHEDKYLHVYYDQGKFVVGRSKSPGLHDRLIITTRARLLSLNLDKMWGGDLLSIGYGIDVQVFEELSLEKNLDIVCVRLISRYPLFKDDVKHNASRVLKYYFNNPSLTNLWISQKIKLRPYVNKYPFNERDHWVTYNKCELCKVCHIPELDFEQLAATHP